MKANNVDNGRLDDLLPGENAPGDGYGLALRAVGHKVVAAAIHYLVIDIGVLLQDGQQLVGEGSAEEELDVGLERTKIRSSNKKFLSLTFW